VAAAGNGLPYQVKPARLPSHYVCDSGLQSWFCISYSHTPYKHRLGLFHLVGKSNVQFSERIPRNTTVSFHALYEFAFNLHVYNLLFEILSYFRVTAEMVPWFVIFPHQLLLEVKITFNHEFRFQLPIPGFKQVYFASRKHARYYHTLYV